ncbi:hypothetical protein [Caudoviricetes sp.]|nr:hypothetical protein [Caudoviricetes sp.]
MTIKKAFNPIFDLLTANPDALVKDLLPQLTALMSSSNTVGQTSYKDEQGNVIAIYCYYHKKWELIANHEYGVKAGSSTGLNTMCKLGVSEWTKQQRKAKQAGELLLKGLTDGAIQVSDLVLKQEEIENQRTSIVYAESYSNFFETLDELKVSLDSTKSVKKAKGVKAKDKVEI